MQSKNLNAKNIDLNELSPDGKLAYTEELKKDLSQPTNIFAFRIFEYLNEESRKLLLITLIEFAQPGTIFMLGGSVPDKDGTIQPFRLPKEYIPSFFQNRNDIEILKNECIEEKKDNEKKHIRDFVIVARKRLVPKKYAEDSYKKWFAYTNASMQGGKSALILHNYKIHFTTYTGYFFERFDLKLNLNLDCKSVLQLGANTGNQLIEYKELGWQTTAYDYCDAAIEYMKNKKINAKNIDLNEVVKGKLAYADDLKQDLIKPCNIFIFRVLMYLNKDARELLIYNLIEFAQPGSIFMIGEAICSIDGHPMCLPKNYIPQFFQNRKDINIIKEEYVEKAHDENQIHDRDVMLVAQKL